MRTTQPPVDLQIDNEGQPNHLNYATVKIRGAFDYGNQIFIVNRKKKTGFENWKSIWFSSYTWDDTEIWKTEVGHIVITPFILSNGKGKILVNRGWISKDEKKKWDERQQAKQVGQPVVITGIVRKTSEKPSLYQMLVNNPQNNQWSYRDIEGMSKQLDTLPVFVDMDKKSANALGDVVIGGQSFIDLENTFKNWEYVM